MGLHENTRNRLPNRRAAEVVKFRCWSMPFHATLGYYPDGKLGEVFLSAGKLTLDADIMSKEAAIALSFALQYGAPIEEIRNAMPRADDGSAQGPIGTLMDIIADDVAATSRVNKLVQGR